VTEETYFQVLAAIHKWIASQFTIRKGACVSGMCTLTWRKVTKLNNEAVLRPVFIPMESFIKAHNLQWREIAPTPEEVVKAEDINFAKIAIRFSENLNKDTVFTCTRHLQSQIGKALASGTEVAISLGVGCLFAKDRKLDFAFTAEVSRGVRVAGEGSSRAGGDAPPPLARDAETPVAGTVGGRGESADKEHRPRNARSVSSASGTSTSRARGAGAGPVPVLRGASATASARVSDERRRERTAFVNLNGAQVRTAELASARGGQASGRVVKGGARSNAEYAADLVRRAEAEAAAAGEDEHQHPGQWRPCAKHRQQDPGLDRDRDRQHLTLRPGEQQHQAATSAAAQEDVGEMPGLPPNRTLPPKLMPGLAPTRAPPSTANSAAVSRHEAFLAVQSERFAQERAKKEEEERRREMAIDQHRAKLNADAIHLKQQMRIKKQDYAQFLKTQIAQKPERQPKMGIDRPLMPCEQREKSLIDVQMRQGQYKMELEEQMHEREWSKYMLAEEERISNERQTSEQEARMITEKQTRAARKRQQMLELDTAWREQMDL